MVCTYKVNDSYQWITRNLRCKLQHFQYAFFCYIVARFYACIRSSSECGRFWSDSGSLRHDAGTIIMCGGCESARRWFVADALLVWKRPCYVRTGCAPGIKACGAGLCRSDEGFESVGKTCVADVPPVFLRTTFIWSRCVDGVIACVFCPLVLCPGCGGAFWDLAIWPTPDWWHGNMAIIEGLQHCCSNCTYCRYHWGEMSYTSYVTKTIMLCKRRNILQII